MSAYGEEVTKRFAEDGSRRKSDRQSPPASLIVAEVRLEAERMRCLRRWREVAGWLALLGAGCGLDASTNEMRGSGGGGPGRTTTGLGGLGGSSVTGGTAGTAGAQAGSTTDAGTRDAATTPGVGDAEVPLDAARENSSVDADSAQPDA